MSQDKQFIFLPYQVLDNQQSLTPSNESAVQVWDCLKWETHTLNPKDITKPMKESLADLPLGEVIDFNFVGKSEHIMITLKVNKKKNILKGKHNLYTRWIIFNAESGNKDLDISNDPDQSMPNIGLSFDNVGVDDSKEEEKK